MSQRKGNVWKVTALSSMRFRGEIWEWRKRDFTIRMVGGVRGEKRVSLLMDGVRKSLLREGSSTRTMERQC